MACRAFEPYSRDRPVQRDSYFGYDIMPYATRGFEGYIGYLATAGSHRESAEATSEQPLPEDLWWTQLWPAPVRRCGASVPGGQKGVPQLAHRSQSRSSACSIVRWLAAKGLRWGLVLARVAVRHCSLTRNGETVQGSLWEAGSRSCSCRDGVPQVNSAVCIWCFDRRGDVHGEIV